MSHIFWLDAVCRIVRRLVSAKGAPPNQPGATPQEPVSDQTMSAIGAVHFRGMSALGCECADRVLNRAFSPSWVCARSPGALPQAGMSWAVGPLVLDLVNGKEYPIQ